MKKYLVVDGMMSGTGVRDMLEGGYLKLDELALSLSLREEIKSWLLRYEDAHLLRFDDLEEVKKLDKEGVNVVLKMREEIPSAKIEYYSNASMKKIVV